MELELVAKIVDSPLLSTVCAAWQKLHEPHVSSGQSSIDVQHADMFTAMHEL